MAEANVGKLEINSLHERHSGLTASLGGSFFEAASVCLSRHHNSPVEFEIACSGETTKRIIDFESPDLRVQNAWANEIDTTEAGAYGVCLAAVEAEEQMIAVRRAETLTGADWYIAPIGTEPADLEDCFRLEISGVDAGDRAFVEARLRQKIAQTRRGASNLPAVASVVGFKGKAVLIQKVQSEK
ncbi:MAG: hypothetical protein OJF51_000086 [Nitrospira sp.]|jgi:hypothetical protein|nr:MAG: hypothetical protein OJF51_000086 [Nitrospira sp.]